MASPEELAGAGPSGPGDVPEAQPFPVVFLVSTVLFPGGTAQAQLRTLRNIVSVDAHPDPETLFLFVFAAGADPESVLASQFAPVGVVGRIVSRLRLPDGSWQIAMQGLRRARIGRWVTTEPTFEAIPLPPTEIPVPRGTAEVLTLQVLQLVEVLVHLDDAYTPELGRLLQSNLDEPGRFADLVAMTVALDLGERMAVLADLSVESRLRRVADVLQEKVEVARIAREIEKKALGEISQAQREHYLRRQMKAIRAELGEEAREEADARRYSSRADGAGLPEEAGRAVRVEIERLRLLSAASSEYAVVQQWLEWVLDMPWAKESEDRLDVSRVREALDEDHEGLEKPKQRILEYLAVRALAPGSPGPILCFAGPPGTGKTSLAQSIARAMDRRLVRISVGGVHDESQIRGHRRTYVGAMPGRIVQALRRAGTRNPVLVIDEVDKMSAGVQGDPSAALLEVLDPEQNRDFRDHYLDLPFDLSHVLFVTTANTLHDIPGPLLDRMEVVELAGYTEKEKVAIARRHLLPRALERTGTRGRVRVSVAGLRTIVRHYTMEAGVRGLGRRLEELCRKYAVRIAAGEKGRFTAGAAGVERLLGRPPVRDSERRSRPEVGVVTGLAWTPYGGDVLVIEGLLMPGAGGFSVTGSLGDVMRESVQAAASWVRSHHADLGIDPAGFPTRDVHIHFPEGAVPKDGPSAGVAVTTALVSLYTGRPVRADLAMTGEVTLRGRVLPIGGVREKVTAAARAGIRTVLLPEPNVADARELGPEVLRSVRIVGVSTVSDVLEAALLPAPRRGRVAPG